MYKNPPENTIRLEAYMYGCGTDCCGTVQARINAVVQTEDGIRNRQIWESDWLYDDEISEVRAQAREACKHYGIETDEFDDW